MTPHAHKESCADCPTPLDGCPCPKCTDLAVAQALKELLEDGEVETSTNAEGETVYRLTSEN